MNPFDLSGPDFLRFFGVLLVALIVAAGLVRHSLRTPVDDPGPIFLDPYQSAMLAGGYQAAAEAAIVALTARNVLSLGPSGRLLAVAPLPMGGHSVEQAVCAAVAAGSPGSPVGLRAAALASKLEHRGHGRCMTQAQMATFQRVDSLLRSASQPVPGAPPGVAKAAARPALAQVERDLQRQGLLMSPAQQANVRAVPALIVLVAGVLGGVRLALGMMAGHAVGYLIVALIATGIAVLLFIRQPDPRSRRGRLAVRHLRRSNAALRSTAVAAAGSLAGADLALAVGLWGPGVLTGSPLSALGTALRPRTAGGSDSGLYTSCSGSSCGGGSSSCGGGCGGGCGG